MALLAYAGSPEETLLRRIGAFDAAALFRAIESGALDLSPTPDSGWYDYQWHALETLVVPERAREHPKLRLNANYRTRLREVFLGAIAGDRETHIKNLPVLWIGGFGAFSQGPVDADVSPQFDVEPLPTVYLRLGRAYRFLGAAMGEILGDRLHGIEVSDPLAPDAKLGADEAIERMAMLMFGLYERACRDVGLTAAYLDGELVDHLRMEADALAGGWLSGIEHDPHLAADVRMAVPVYVWPDGRIRNWARLGVRLEPVTARYVDEPEVLGVLPSFVPTEYAVATVAAAEFYGRLQTRNEFRALCDAHPTEADLRAALGASVPRSARPGRTVLYALTGLVALFLAVIGWRRIARSRRRRCLRGGGIVLLAGLTAFGAAMAALPQWRTRFLVAHVISRNRVLAVLAASRYRPRESDARRAARIRGLIQVMADGRPQARFVGGYILTYEEATGKSPAQLLDAEWAAPLLLRAARDTIPDVAGLAEHILSDMDHPEVTAFFLDRLRSDGTLPGSKISAIHAAGRTGHPELMEEVLRLALRGQGWEGRAALGCAFRLSTDPRVMEAMEAALYSDDALLMRGVIGRLRSGLSGELEVLPSIPRDWRERVSGDEQRKRIEEGILRAVYYSASDPDAKPWTGWAVAFIEDLSEREAIALVYFESLVEKGELDDPRRLTRRPLDLRMLTSAIWDLAGWFPSEPEDARQTSCLELDHRVGHRDVKDILERLPLRLRERIEAEWRNLEDRE